MDYKDEMPENKQITLDKFPLLPGDKISIKFKGVTQLSKVIEVGSANPEYVLGGPYAKGAAIKVWNIKQKRACIKFLKEGGHKLVKIRLKKSVWAIIEKLDIYIDIDKKITIKKTPLRIYTYEIIDLMKKGALSIIS